MTKQIEILVDTSAGNRREQEIRDEVVDLMERKLTEIIEQLVSDNRISNAESVQLTIS